MLTGIFLLPDNARSHTIATIKEKIGDFRREPSITHLAVPILHLPTISSSYTSNRGLLDNFQAMNFYTEGLKKLVQRYAKYLEVKSGSFLINTFLNVQTAITLRVSLVLTCNNKQI